MDTQLIAALDTRDLKKAKFLIKELKDLVFAFKIGPELFLSHGFESLKILDSQSCKIFLDLKFFDIPSVIKKGIRIVAEYNIVMFTMHLLGGQNMLSQTVEYVKSLKKDVMPLGVTVLTSMQQEDINKAGFNYTISELVLRLAGLAKESKVEGLVCSVKEVDVLRENFKNSFKLVTPGIRLQGEEEADQKRIETPLEASKRGADFIVIGRSLLDSPSPKKKAEEVLAQL